MIKGIISGLLLPLLAMLMVGCGPKKVEEAVTIAINPWPGYELLYLAKQKGFYRQVGANIELVQVSTLSDAQRAYLTGHVDGFASTMIEAIQVAPLGGKPIKIVLLADYSDGGDVIIAPTSIENMQALRGQTIGCEVSSLGIFVLERALRQHQMQLDDVNVINVEQGAAVSALALGKIAAMVTYPPYSVEIQSSGDYLQLFSTKEIPEEVLDTLSISSSVLAEHPQLVDQIHQAWQLTLDYMRQHPEEAMAIMAKREGLQVAEFKEALADLKLLSSEEQHKLFAQRDKLTQLGYSVCETLVKIGAIESDCLHVDNLFYQVP
ncbi:ABC transporter substrate-binding protein [Shewanella sp. Isolate8]|uniref:ABC transporter substrate-binding protein n=1 Tax=Shewanella sp. Isolate8 TaxID=2908529 RepID=UPI001EFEE291|nr:ABC transporter substrate-binding protein [Shewanella sp. Isolate8]MCG9748787.1 ABC transporter substrate-binding protein [Shewanella sp. Isolate8]